MYKKLLRRFVTFSCIIGLSACSQFQYQPIETINKVDYNKGYRLKNMTSNPHSSDDLFVILLLSGGGSRAASLGYGVLEALKEQNITINGRQRRLIDEVDVVSGVSGGSVLAAYFSLHGADTIPSFEKRFLNKNFQREIISQVFSFANMPRLTSPQFGRGDLLQEQFEQTLFGNATFGDLVNKRKGPFALISATDMTQGIKVNFTQEFFDMLCLNLSDMRIARAVAASSSVPMVFSPLSLNNNGGNCGYNINNIVQNIGIKTFHASPERFKVLNQQNQAYSNSKERPYIHLIDGGLTDNIGLSSLLQITQLTDPADIYKMLNGGKANKIVLLSVNAQNQTTTDIDQKSDVPGLGDALNAVINIPIDKASATSIASTRAFVDEWNNSHIKNYKGEKVNIYFINLELKDLENPTLRQKVLNISTSFYLMQDDVNALRKSARLLLSASKDYQNLLHALH
ncbi:NTE family protein [Cricetibacter osteomyelitidis]|uniref:NTE family protein n=1 Tax=Cricetibacter osteomyelitidis TaxID=1521931 RepID=A0A4R2TKB9_9PAST|nr:patatin-like phospholipase family protein [Cricetibacter osteomyelitidis]TCP97738.1 NTE family protein [Cricetibacter osteomyelitidis]